MYKLYTVEDLLSLQDDPNRWIIKGMIPRIGRTIVYGAGGEYKTTLMFDLGVAVAGGGLFLEQFDINAFGPVVIFSTEGDIYANRDRIKSHIKTRNVHPETVKVFYGQDAIKPTEDEGYSMLRTIIGDIRPIMVLMDPLISFFSGDENSTRDVSLFTEKMNELIKEFEFSCVLIHHANKAGAIRGNSAWQGWIDALIKCSVEKDVNLPGVPQAVNILTVQCEKMRNGGQSGKLFTAVPFINDNTKMVTFAIYNNTNTNGIIVTYLKQAMYEYLLQTGALLTSSELAELFHVGYDRASEALNWLARDGLIDQSGLSLRSTSRDGSRTKKVNAWRAAPAMAKVDAARVMMQAISSEAHDVDQREPRIVLSSRVPQG